MSLAALNLVKQYNKRLVVDGVSIEVQPGEVVGLLGPNGAGKTTTFYLIVGLIRLREGSIHLGEDEITNLPMYIRARRGIGYLAQEPSVFRKLTVAQNIRAVLETIGLPPNELTTRLYSLLEELGLTDLAEQRADRLSGGEARRLEITRALAREPKFLLLDEPFAGIDPKAVELFQAIISDLKRRGIGLLITDHNVR
ncbi:MAG TPA: LPS export ABC transporter ATP-binding protein, partial [Candidatus Latescibacteria bacterium]|nr:LPS export ABC transporter ATP-binding protein [Candidatus Latescibacterota bacterium]